MLIIPIALVACGKRDEQTSIYQPEQLLSATEDLRDSLAASELLRDRNESSPEIRLLVDRLENFSSERMPRTDQLMAVARVVSDDGMLQMLRSKNARVVFVRDDLTTLNNLGIRSVYGSGAQPATHQLNARFYSITRTKSSDAGPSDSRSDEFSIIFGIVDTATGGQVWSASSRFRRASVGRQVD